MHITQRVISQIGRTLLKKQQQQFPLQQQQQQSLLTLACCSAGNHTEPESSNSNKNINLSQKNRPSLLSPAALTTSSSLLFYPAQSYSKFTAARESLPLGSHPLCEERALDLISNLKETELAAIKLALAKYEAKKQKEGFEAEKAVSPSSADLWKIFFVNAVPFVAFGFLDNFTMIIAGDYIEYIFGTFMCISTMAAAGLGNTISDVLGIGSAYYVERGCEILGLRPPDLTPIQMEMKSSRRAANYGRIIGITVGCLVGMFPLLFMDRKAIEDERKEEEERKKLGLTKDDELANAVTSSAQ
ncbi:transmembrane protein 65 isoform X2 [Musca autumnalis]|uniref:transmembrane protein 65 isoform X2 n=1 Tax=Musca autumnalis TaxID=221902 RepID=UPI003CFB5134